MTDKIKTTGEQITFADIKPHLDGLVAEMKRQFEEANKQNLLPEEHRAYIAEVDRVREEIHSALSILNPVAGILSTACSEFLLTFYQVVDDRKQAIGQINNLMADLNQVRNILANELVMKAPKILLN